MTLDGIRIATCGASKAKIWRAKYDAAGETLSLKSDPARVNRLKEGEYVCQIAWNHSYKVLATGSNKGTILLIAVDTDAKLSPFYHGEPVTCLKFSSSSRYLCAASASKVSLWDLKTKKAEPLLEWKLPSPAICADFDASQKRLVVGLQSGVLYSWEIKRISHYVDNDRVSARKDDNMFAPIEVEGAEAFVNACFFQKPQHPMKNWLVTAEADGSIRIWDTNLDPWEEVWEVPESGIHPATGEKILLCTHSADSGGHQGGREEEMKITGPGVFASASSDGTINVFDSVEQIHMFQFKLDVSVTCLDFFPDGYELVVGDSTCMIQVLDTRSTSPVATVTTDEIPLQILTQHPPAKAKSGDKKESATDGGVTRSQESERASSARDGVASSSSMLEYNQVSHQTLPVNEGVFKSTLSTLHAKTPPQPPPNGRGATEASPTVPGTSQERTPVSQPGDYTTPVSVSPIEASENHVRDGVTSSQVKDIVAQSLEKTLSESLHGWMNNLDAKIDAAIDKMERTREETLSAKEQSTTTADKGMSNSEIRRLIQEQVTNAVSESIEPVSQKLQNMHLEILRQAHTMKREVSNLLQDHHNQLQAVYEENERLRKENEDLKRYY
eukprot:gb/GECG01016615.1/.p1 GENE.gb/GECG01016615.1/~~gb/GECG01016615.1/.p1  ORF type:complete len:613 (+),score=86.61 gb/GECG01016615.1/:1-1839(+)